jgi:hypothetical protein
MMDAKSINFVMNKSLPRRTFLRGAGAAVALPLLDAMLPVRFTASARAASQAVPRLGFFYIPNGVYPTHFHPTGSGGTDYQLTQILEPIKDLRQHVNVMTGLSNLGALSHDEGGGVHTRAHSAWLNGVHPKRTEGADVQVGKTIDQYAADTLGAETSLRSLELTTDSNFLVGACENGYSCAYMNSTSWRGPNTPLPHERDPRVVFQRMFGDGGSVQARLAQMQKDRSILDSVTDSMKRLQRQLGIPDRGMVSDYFDAVREIEQRIQRAETTNATRPLPAMQAPTGVPDDYDEHMKILMDLLVLAYQGDITRVSCMQYAREQSFRSYPNLGVPEAHHSVSHHQHDPHAVEQYTKISTYEVSLFARFVDKLRTTPDGDGTLLDHSIMVWGGGMGDGDTHAPMNLPIVIAGRGRGTIKTGRHIVYATNTPFMNLGLTLLDHVGAQVPERIGDSTGLLEI